MRQAIFESFEPDSDDESDQGPTSQVDAYREFKREADKAIELMKANGLRIEDSDSDDDFDLDEPAYAPANGSKERKTDTDGEDEREEEDEEDEGTGVMTSQLRHFVIQVSWC